jgi:uncharacterized membrane protein
MANSNKIITSTIAAFMALVASSNTNAATPAPEMEQCYGIVKAGMNDCATANQACAGSATKDNQPDAFIFLPKGICTRIVGGTLKSTDKAGSKQ